MAAMLSLLLPVVIFALFLLVMGATVMLWGILRRLQGVRPKPSETLLRGGIARFVVGTCPWNFELWRPFEYWHRTIIGPVYVLWYRPVDHGFIVEDNDSE
jgi:hypothetical protein